MSHTTHLTQALAIARASVAQAHTDLAAVTAAIAAATVQLEQALAQAEQTTLISADDPAALRAFLAKPYLVRALGQGRYELIVPRFVGLKAGWPKQVTESYIIYEVSRFLQLLQPLPAWLQAEIPLPAPAFQATLDGLDLVVTAGDPAMVAQQIGRQHIARRSGTRLTLRPASRFDVLRRIIREEGFIPFAPTPVRALLRSISAVARAEDGLPAFTLRPHQQATYEQFLDTGAVCVFAYPQTGKTFVALQACADLVGPKLILCPRRVLVQQWQARLAAYLTPAAAAEVRVMTYQAARRAQHDRYTLVVYDEAHHLPADFAVETATTIQADARLALSATPIREDGQHEIIPALAGFPSGADWPVAPLQRPTVTVWIVPDVAAKLRRMQQLCAKPTPGKTLIFTQRLDLGERAAALLGVPFIWSKTKDPLTVLADHACVVASSVLDEGISASDGSPDGVQRIVEIDFLFGSRMQAGQRTGRLANVGTEQTTAGEHHILMTPDEYQKYGKRLLLYEHWGLDVRVELEEQPRSPGRPAPQAAAAQPPRSAARSPRRTSPSQDQRIADLEAVPALAARLQAAREAVDAKTASYMPMLLNVCSRASLTVEEIAAGRGTRSARMRGYLRAAARALVRERLLMEDSAGRLTRNTDEIARLRHLATVVQPGGTRTNGAASQTRGGA